MPRLGSCAGGRAGGCAAGRRNDHRTSISASSAPAAFMACRMEMTSLARRRRSVCRSPNELFHRRSLFQLDAASRACRARPGASAERSWVVPAAERRSAATRDVVGDHADSKASMQDRHRLQRHACRRSRPCRCAFVDDHLGARIERHFDRFDPRQAWIGTSPHASVQPKARPQCGGCP